MEGRGILGPIGSEKGLEKNWRGEKGQERRDQVLKVEELFLKEIDSILRFVKDLHMVSMLLTMLQL